MAVAAPAFGQAPQVPLINSGMAASLLGASVVSADGKAVGTVTGVKPGSPASIGAIQVTTGAFLGLGEKTIAIPATDFQVVDGRVLLAVTNAGLGSYLIVRE